MVPLSSSTNSLKERFFTEPHPFETSRHKQTPSDAASFPTRTHNLQLLPWLHNTHTKPEFHYNLANDGGAKIKHI